VVAIRDGLKSLERLLILYEEEVRESDTEAKKVLKPSLKARHVRRLKPKVNSRDRLTQERSTVQQATVTRETCAAVGHTPGPLQKALPPT
jgi:hypothetical protein